MTQLKTCESTFDLSSTSVLIIGSGRLAKHLDHWLNLKNTHHFGNNLKYTSWNRSQSLENLTLKATSATNIWLAISDRAIADFYENNRTLFKDKSLIHFSGSYHHPQIYSVHPLMTFSNDLYELDFYEKIYLTTFGQNKLSDLAPFLKNPTFQIAEEHQKIYHALCVVSGNLPQMLWQKTKQISDSLNIPDQAFTLFWQQCLQNFLKHPSTAVTGPIVRGDTNTIKDNIESLEKNLFLKNMYQSAAQFYKDKT